MPPRHAYWTIIVDEQPTSFRAHDVEELLPTFNRLREKHPSAILKWFERGRLWDSRDAARQAGGGAGERGRWRDENARTEDVRTGRASDRDEPRGYPRRDDGDRRRQDRTDERRGGARSGGTSVPPTPPDRRDDASAGAPPADRERRDRSWRPGGEHRDPRQQYKDAKKAKWSRFKQNVRSKWESRQDRERPGPGGPERPEPDRGEHTPPHGDPLRPKVAARSDQQRDARPPWRREDRRDGWKPKGPPRGREAWRGSRRPARRVAAENGRMEAEGPASRCGRLAA